MTERPWFESANIAKQLVENENLKLHRERIIQIENINIALECVLPMLEIAGTDFDLITIPVLAKRRQQMYYNLANGIYGWLISHPGMEICIIADKSLRAARCLLKKITMFAHYYESVYMYYVIKETPDQLWIQGNNSVHDIRKICVMNGKANQLRGVSANFLIVMQHEKKKNDHSTTF
jgi:hypothetical protein